MANPAGDREFGRCSAISLGVKPKILIVDDIKEVLVTMSRHFEAHGFDVDTASEREEAEALLGANRYQVLITDLQLTPIRSNEGLEIIRQVRHESPDTRVIMLTAYTTEEVEREVTRYGISSFLKKPVSLSLLRRTVLHSLGRPVQE